MSQRFHPYAAPGNHAADMLPVIPPTSHSFVYIKGPYCFEVKLTPGMIQWNNQTVPCLWEFGLDDSAAPAVPVLRLHFHHRGIWERAKHSVYKLVLNTAAVRVWRDDAWGGQALLQIMPV